MHATAQRGEEVFSFAIDLTPPVRAEAIVWRNTDARGHLSESPSSINNTAKASSHYVKHACDAGKEKDWRQCQLNRVWNVRLDFADHHEGPNKIKLSDAAEVCWTLNYHL